MKNKIILVDTSGIFVPTVKVVNRLRQQKAETGNPSFILPARVMYFNSLISCLKKIGVKKDDIIIMAGEGHSWRKDIDANYKAQREGLRQKDTFVNWDYEFKQLNDLHDQLNKSTNWYFIRVAEGLEADDIIAISCRFFKDKEVIIVTGDKDLHQLAFYNNIKIFNTNKKIKGTKGSYEDIKNPLKIIADKSRLGDKGDNIIPEINETEEDIQLRYQLVNLLELPDEIEEKGIDVLKIALSVKKELNLEYLPKFKNCKEKFLTIYNSDNIITFEYCQQLLEKRKERKNKIKKEKINGNKIQTK